MRISVAGSLIALFVLAASTPPIRADADKDAKAIIAKAIIAKAIEAKGGQANLDKYKGTTAAFKGAVSVMGMEVTMSGTMKNQSPDKLRLDASMKVGGQDIAFSQIVNGNKGWVGANGNYSEMDKEMLADASDQFYAAEITDLQGLNASGVKLKGLGESKVDDKPVVGVRVSSTGHRDISLFIDKKSGLVVKVDSSGKDPSGGEFKSESFYSDYKKVNNLMVAHKVKVLHDGTPYMTMEMTSVTMSEKLDDKDFAKP
jgi:hypothetical protein